MTTPPKLQSSFSSNDVPTVKNQPGANNHAQQHFHNHNASMGRIPAGAVPNRHSRELSGDSNIGAREQSGPFQSIQSALHANAPPFGPSGSTLNQNAMHNTQSSQSSTSASSQAMASPTGSINPAYSYYNGNGAGAGAGAGPGPNNAGNYGPSNPTTGPPVSGGYSVPYLNMGMQAMNLNGPTYAPQNFTNFGGLYGPAAGNQPGHRDSQARVIQHRRQQDNEGKSCNTSSIIPTRRLTSIF